MQQQYKKLIFNANHRGMKETDILLGKYADSCLESLSPDQLFLFEQMLSEQDADILDWFMGKVVPPQNYKGLVLEILAFHQQQR